MEKLLEEVSFDAEDRRGETLVDRRRLCRAASSRASRATPTSAATCCKLGPILEQSVRRHSSPIELAASAAELLSFVSPFQRLEIIMELGLNDCSRAHCDALVERRSRAGPADKCRRPPSRRRPKRRRRPPTATTTAVPGTPATPAQTQTTTTRSTATTPTDSATGLPVGPTATQSTTDDHDTRRRHCSRDGGRREGGRFDLRHQAAARVGKIESVSAPRARSSIPASVEATIPISSFAKNDKGLVIAMTKAEVERCRRTEARRSASRARRPFDDSARSGR